MLIAIGFSGTQFNFVLPHTNSATFGLLLCILTLLALTRGHFLLAGTAIGMTALTRVEFAAAAGVAGLAWAVGIWREEDLRAALRALAWMAGPALAIPVAVLGTLAASVGADRLFWQNLWPIDFLRAAGFNAYREWTPFDAASVASSLARGAIYLALLAGLTATAVKFHGARGVERAKALWPLAAACLGSALLLAAWKASGVFAGAEAAVQEESKQLLLGMSWLPLLSLLAAALVARALLRRQDAPLTGRWPLDLALVAVAVLLCSRAYDDVHDDLRRALLRRPGGAAARPPAPAGRRPLAQRPAGRDGDAGRRSPRASPSTPPSPSIPTRARSSTRQPATSSATTRSAGAQQQAIDFLRGHTAPGEPVLALPADAGTYFLTDRPQALYENMFLPGLLDTRADERAAIARLKREGVRYALVSNRDTSAFETGRFGVGYDQLLGRYLRSGRLVATFGDLEAAPGGGNPSQGFRVYALR